MNTRPDEIELGSGRMQDWERSLTEVKHNARNSHQESEVELMRSFSRAGFYAEVAPIGRLPGTNRPFETSLEISLRRHGGGLKGWMAIPKPASWVGVKKRLSLCLSLCPCLYLSRCLFAPVSISLAVSLSLITEESAAFCACASWMFRFTFLNASACRCGLSTSRPAETRCLPARSIGSQPGIGVGTSGERG